MVAILGLVCSASSSAATLDTPFTKLIVIGSLKERLPRL